MKQNKNQTAKQEPVQNDVSPKQSANGSAKGKGHKLQVLYLAASMLVMMIPLAGITFAKGSELENRQLAEFPSLFIAKAENAPAASAETTDQKAESQKAGSEETNNQGANGQEANDQGANDQGANDQGANDQGANNQEIKTINPQFLPELGEWFEDHFFGRVPMADANSRLLALTGSSGRDSVILGKDGWLYYADTLPYYDGSETLSSREVRNIVHNLQLINSYVTRHGSKLALAIAPNKNTIYPEYMPERYLHQPSTAIDDVQKAAAEAGIPVARWNESLLESKNQTGQSDQASQTDQEGQSDQTNQTDQTGQPDQQLYYTEDSHWNPLGAMIGWNDLAEIFGKNTVSQPENQQETNRDPGDLAGMLYPFSAKPESDQVFDNLPEWSMQNGVTDPMTEKIITKGSGQGSLLMFRDSFANNLIPFVSSNYETVVYDRQVPYNLLQIEALPGCDVVIERVERRLNSLQEQASLIRMPVVENFSGEIIENNSTIRLVQDGDFIRISGTVDPDHLATNTDLFIQVERPDGKTYTYPVFYTDQDPQAETDEKSDGENGNGYDAFLEKQAFAEGMHAIRLLSMTDGKAEQLLEIQTDPAGLPAASAKPSLS